jgi:FAD/FMN-containing dehydrogenase
LNRKVVYSGSTQYNTTISGFFSGQCRDDTPSCIVQPTRAEDVSDAVTILAEYGCQFSVKGGGHTPWAGAASFNGGVTIDMAKLNTTTLNHDKTIASIGAGSRWGEVYNTLIPTGYMVAGGRDSTVGVGGLILGGMLTSQLSIAGDGLTLACRRLLMVCSCAWLCLRLGRKLSASRRKW